MSEFKLLIDSTERAGSTGICEGVTDPATRELIGRVAYTTKEDLDRAVEAAGRGAILRERNASLGLAMTSLRIFPNFRWGGKDSGYGTEGRRHILAPTRRQNSSATDSAIRG